MLAWLDLCWWNLEWQKMTHWAKRCAEWTTKFWNMSFQSVQQVYPFLYWNSTTALQQNCSIGPIHWLSIRILILSEVALKMLQMSTLLLREPCPLSVENKVFNGKNTGAIICFIFEAFNPVLLNFLSFVLIIMHISVIVLSNIEIPFHWTKVWTTYHSYHTKCIPDS